MSEGIAATTPAENPPEVKAETRTVRPPLVRRPLFALVDLGCAVVAAALWYLSDGRLGPWPLLVAAIPWGVRLASGRFPLTRTRFDLLLLLFLLSAAVAASVSHSPQLAWNKFWLLTGATVLFYALAGQRSPTIWIVVRGLAVVGGLVGLYFLLTHDFRALPAKLAFANDMGLTLQGVRPAFLSLLHALHPNVAGGLIALLFPFAVATLTRDVKKHRGAWLVIGVISTILMLFGLVLTTSRGAWLALAGGLVSWVFWMASGRLSPLLYLSRRNTLALALVALGGLLLSIALLAPGGLVGLANRLPGPSTAGSRLEISRDALDLVGDFPFTGGGLSSFDGLYSQYIRVVPQHYLIHGHSLFLDVAVEQGFAGLLLLLAMITLGFWWLSDPATSGLRPRAHGTEFLCGATFAVMTVVCLHGLVEDPLYGSRGALLLWLPLGMTAFLFPRQERVKGPVLSREGLIVVGAAAVGVLGLGLLYWSQLQSAWQSNWGALQMARIQLEGYPTNVWSDGREAIRLVNARTRFEQALELNDDNRTAWHRLGEIHLLQREFEPAQDALFNAALLDPDHRGIRKSLAYAGVWNNDLAGALPLLRSLPESVGELDAYTTWWREQGREDLSRQAAAARSAMDVNTQP